MADSDLEKAQREVAKEAAVNSQNSLKAIKDLLEQDRVDNKLQAKDRVKLLKQSELIQKSNRTLSSDLGKNFSDLKDGFTSSVDGLISSTFGPFSGIVSSFTTGFAKRAEEAAEQIDAQNAAAEQGKELTEKLGGVKETGENTVFQLKRAVEELKEINGKQPEIDPDDPFGNKKFKGFGGMSVPSGTSGTGTGDGGDEGTGGGVRALLTGLGIGSPVGLVAAIKAYGARSRLLASRLTSGLLGRVFATVGAISLAKDIWDITKDTSDKDFRTKVKNEDLVGVILGFIGGGIGAYFGGPFGAMIGAGLGNTIGNIIGSAFDSPDTRKAIETMRATMTASRDILLKEKFNAEKLLAKTKDKEEIARLEVSIEEINDQIERIDDRIKLVDDKTGIIAKKRIAFEKADKDYVTQRGIMMGLEEKLAQAETDEDLETQRRINGYIAIQEKFLEASKQKYTDTQKSLNDLYASTVEGSANSLTDWMDQQKTIVESSSFMENPLATLSTMFGFFGNELGGNIKTNILMTQAKKELDNMKLGKDEIERQINKEKELIKKDSNNNKTTKELRTLEKQLIGLQEQIILKDTEVNSLTEKFNKESKIITDAEKKHTGGPINNSGLYNLEAKEMVFTEEQTKVLASYIPSSGQVMNRLQMERMGDGGMHGASVVTGNDMSSNQISNNNTTVINNPSPIGQTLFDEGRDFVSRIG